MIGSLFLMAHRHYKIVTSGWKSMTASFLLFFVPTIGGFGGAFAGIPADGSTTSIVVSIFSIFAALLFNAQVAIFGIAQREWIESQPSSSDTVSLLTPERRQKLKSQKKSILRDVNCNISYLIIYSLSSLIILLIVHFSGLRPCVYAFLASFLVLHFAANILGVVWRTHVLFDKEYEIL